MGIFDDVFQAADEAEAAKRPPPRTNGAAANSNGAPADGGPFSIANAILTADVCDFLGIEHDGRFASCPGCGESGAAISLDRPGLKCMHNRCSSKGKDGWRSNVDLTAEVRNCTPVEAVNLLAGRFGFEGVRAKQVGKPAQPEAPKADGAIQWHSTTAVFAPLPPTNWIVPGLQMCPGRPTELEAYGATGKTIIAQSIGLCVAAGVRIFGEFRCGAGLRVRHCDYEQGLHATFKRYQRIALGMGIDPAALEGRLEVSIFPSVYLNSTGAEDIWAKAFDGVALGIFDALRGAIPGSDENDSGVRLYLDALTRVSEKTGTNFLLLHHAGKTKDNHADARQRGRGSSAIFDACGCVLDVAAGEKGGPKFVQQTKQPAEAEGGPIEDFYLAFEDVQVGTNPKAGLRVVHMTNEQVNPPEKPGSKFERLKDAIIELVRHDSTLTSKNAIIARVTGGQRNERLQALAELLDQHRISQPGGQGTPFRIA